MVDIKDILQFVLGFMVLILSGLGTVLWFLYLDVRSTARDAISKLEAHVLYSARTYVTDEGLTKAIANLEKMIGSLVEAVKTNMNETRTGFGELYRKIDTKQDK